MELYLRNPRIIYALGGYLERGTIDCSEFVREGFKTVLTDKDRAKKNRTQAWRIYRGLDGFGGYVVDWMRDDFEAQIADLLTLRVPSSLERPYGVNHVGGVVLYRGVFMVIDASSSKKGIAIRPFAGIWTKYLPPDGYRRVEKGK